MLCELAVPTRRDSASTPPVTGSQIMSKLPPPQDDQAWLAQISRPLPDHVNRQIVQIFQAWALFEGALTMWLIALLGVDDDIGRLIVDRIDTRAKISRIKEIYDHMKNDGMAKTAKEVSSNYEKWVDIRNAIAHKIYFGVSEDGTHLMFSTGKYARQERDKMAMIGIDLADLPRCAYFAASAAGQIERGLPPAKMPG
jgi:hypothetical protein